MRPQSRSQTLCLCEQPRRCGSLLSGWATDRGLRAATRLYLWKDQARGEKIVLEQKGKMPFTIIRPPAVYGPRGQGHAGYASNVKFGLIPYWGKIVLFILIR